MKLFFITIISTFLYVSCSNSNATNAVEDANNSSSTENAPPYTLIKQWPHNPDFFIEGLEFKDSLLYESVGDADYSGKSKIAIINQQTGLPILQTTLDKKYFGEGLTIINNKAFMLTYKEEKCFVFDPKTLKQIGQFSYKGEGWGMTNDGSKIMMSNGTNNISIRNPNTFVEENVIAIFDENGPVSNINELEYVNGFLYANQWQTSNILKIDLKTKMVVQKIDFSSLINQYIPENIKKEMNGIAYNKKSNTFFFTGKNWNTMFEVVIN
ncbi:MAG: glutaminyl-peptide cyclotransferase [Chitinophagaceae bacterium]